MDKTTVIIVDNGHGTRQYMKGSKQSPDGKLHEGEWTREIAVMLVDRLKELGFNAFLLVPENQDISLSTRCRRANQIYKENGKKGLLISIHINAAGADGKWHNATGWSGWVAPKSSSNSKRLARILYEEAAKRKLSGNRSVPIGKYWTGNFAIVRDTNCPAVLTENLFQDNKKEVEYLLSPEGKKAIVDLHVDGILKYLNEQ